MRVAMLALPLILFCSACNSKRDPETDTAELITDQEPSRETFDEDLFDTSDKAIQSPFKLHEGPNSRVERVDGSGKTLWSTSLNAYVNNIRAPHLVDDDQRVYVSTFDPRRVMALDARTGKILWTTDWPGERMCLYRGLLVATEGGSSPAIDADGRWLVARAIATGKEMFKVKLPDSMDDVNRVRECAGFLLVQQRFRRQPSLLINDKGQVVLRISKYVIDGVRQADDIVIQTTEGASRLSLKNETKWTITPKRLGDAGGFLPLENGDLIAFWYGPISDSGAGVVRLDPATGTVRWQTTCRSLETGHSKYRHEVTIKLDKDRLKVASIGSNGRWVELLNLQTGKQLRREQRD